MMVDFSIPEVRELIGGLIETYNLNGDIYRGRQPFLTKNRIKVIHELEKLQKAGVFKYYITDENKNPASVAKIKDEKQLLFIQFVDYSNQTMEKLCGNQLLKAQSLELSNLIKTSCDSLVKKSSALLIGNKHSLDEHKKTDPDIKQFYDARFSYDGGNVYITIDGNRYIFSLGGGNPEKVISLAFRKQDKKDGIWRDKLAEDMSQPNLKSLNTVFKDNTLVHTTLAPFIEITTNRIKILKSVKLTRQQAEAIRKQARAVRIDAS